MMGLSTEVARVEGSMINLDYKVRGCYTEKYFEREMSLSSKPIDSNSDYSLIDLIEDIRKYVKAERIKLRKKLKE